MQTAPSSPHPRSAFALGGIALIMALLGGLPALTIPLTMPTSILQIVRVGAAELSLWLLLISGVAALLAGFALRRSQGPGAWVPRIALALGLIGAGLATIPGAQLPPTVDQAETNMRAAFGSGWDLHIPGGVEAQFRPVPFDLGAYVFGIAPGGVRITRDLPFRTVGGQTLRLDRYDPPPSSGWPAPHPGLLVIHGGGWEGGDKGEFAAASAYFAGRGYVVYDIQYRLAPGARFPAQLEDVECALGYLRDHAAPDGLDPERVFMVGRSAGAHLALLAGYRAARDPAVPGCGPPATVRGVIAFYAPTDLREGYLHPAEPDIVEARRRLPQFLGGTPDQVPDAYRAATPQNWLDRPVPPTLLIHGEADQLVRVDQSRLLAAALEAAGDPVVLITPLWAGHGFDYLFSGLAGQAALYYWERFMAVVLTQ